MKKWMLIFCIFSFLIPLVAQKTFDSNHFLREVRQDESVEFQLQKIRYLSTLSHGLRYVERLEFRTETNDFNFAKQEYVLRVSPNSLRNIKTHKQYYETVQFMSEMEMEETLGKAFRKRYDLLVNDVFLDELIRLKKSIQKVLKDKVTFFNRSISLPGFDVLDLIETQDEAQANVRRILDLENEKRTNGQTIQLIQNVDTMLVINKENFISVDDIKQVILENKSKGSSLHPGLKVQSAKLYNTMLEYEWEVAKSKFSIGYLQAKYGYDPNDNFRKSFSIGVGFEIPLKRVANLDLNGLIIKKLESESQYRTIKNQLEEEEYMLSQGLQSRMQKYELVRNQLKEGQAEFVLEEYAKNSEASPKALLKLREITLKNQLLLKQLEFEIVQIYIAYMDMTGLLHQQPFRNYIMKGLPTL